MLEKLTLLQQKFINRYLLMLILSMLSFSLHAEDSMWTIIKTKPHGKFEKSKTGHFWAGPGLKVKLGKVKPGTKVHPIEHREDVYHVRFKDGQIGWVYFTMLKETQKLAIEKPTGLHRIKGTSSFRMGKLISNLKKGDIVTQFGLAKGGGAYYVKTDKGVKGAVIRQHAYPATEDTLPEYNTKEAKIFFLKKDIDAKVHNKSDANLKTEFGMPEALVHKATGDVWYYTYLETYYEGLRYRGISFIVKNNTVIGDNLIGKGESYFIDKLPLFITIKGISSLDVFDKGGENFISKKIKTLHWSIRILLGFTFGFLILSIASFIAFFITMRLALIKTINNGVLILIGSILSIALNYLYFIFISAHVLKEEIWFSAFIMIIILILNLRKISGRINYHRCPRCRTMWSAEDKGSVEIGRKHITQNRSERRLDREYTQSDGRKVKVYTDFKWQEKMTEKQIKDLRYCHNCGFRWHVERVETVNGHV